MKSMRRYAIILLTIQLVPLYAQSEINCPPGQVFVSEECKPCPPGTYRSMNTANTCVKCRAGTFNPISGVGSMRLCRFCEANTFSRAGSARCAKCPKGTVADPGSSRCLACGRGFRVNGNRCEPCNKSTFNDKNASLQCESCPFPFTSPRQSTSRSDCRMCPPGKLASSGGCRVCSPGTFKPRRLGQCELCPPGHVSKSGSTSCTPCPPGTVARGLLRERCVPCPDGTTSNGPGATRCRPIGSRSCPSNTFENANGDCERCSEDFRYNKETKMCEPCPPESLSRGGLQTECRRCPPGQEIEQPGFAGRTCRCPEGRFTAGNKCILCPRGTAGNALTPPSRYGCIACPEGTFSNKLGSTSCRPCPFGTFSDVEGATGCKRCPAGTVPNRAPRIPPFGETIGSVSCVTITTGCPLGFQPGEDVFGRIRCRRVDCIARTPKRDIGFKCLPCRAGFRLNGDRCERCGIDEVSEGGTVTMCTKCKNGLFRDEFDGSECTCRGAQGIGKGIQNGVCTDCPPGTVSSANDEECMKCPRGTFSSGFGEQFCAPCGRGSFSDEEGLASCKTCPEGQVPERVTGSRECVLV